MSSRIIIIPARAGSKGIPNKNIVKINGKPLIVYTIETALKAKRKGIVDKVIVSTDSEKIATIAMNAGAEVPFLRPSFLASDTAKSVDVLIHAINYYKEKDIFYEEVILLQPTTPLRTVEDIFKAIEIYDDSDAKSLITCYKEEYVCDLVSYYKEGNYAVPLNKNHNKGARRQDVKDIYIRNGAIYITDVKYMIDKRKVISDLPLVYEMPAERSYNIDTYSDLELIRWIISE